MYDLVIKNGKVVTASTSYVADVAVSGEKISAIGDNLAGEQEIDASGKLVIPGGVDIHVHMQMALSDDLVSSDTFFTGTRAAAIGGTTTIVDFVDVKPEQSMLDALEARRALTDPQVITDYKLHMTIGPTEIPKLNQVPIVYDAGCTSFKLYMAYGFRLTDDQLYQALSAVRDVGGFPVIHAENWDIICQLIAENLAKGNTRPHWHPRSRPARFEAEAVGRAIDIATYVGTPLHIFHVSCAEAVERIQQARTKGLPITGETCPQYLFLTWDAYDAEGILGTLPVCSPPIRAQEHQDALWHALANEDLQIVTTDHCPFVLADKARGLEDFSKIPGGVPSIEMRLSAIYSQGVRKGILTENQWVDMCCTKPAQMLSMESKGDIVIGKDADIVIFDPKRTITLSTETMHENVDWTPYDGLELQGFPQSVFRRGELIVSEGEFCGTAGTGRFIAG